MRAVERLDRNIKIEMDRQGFQYYKGLPNVTARSLYRIASGSYSPGLNLVEQIAKDLKVEVSDLFR